MFNFTTGLTALRANQVALDIVAQNMANANTPGYHRQAVRFIDRPPIEIHNLLIGTGVDIARIERVRHAITENALTENISAKGDIVSRLGTLRQIETLLLPGSGSVYDRVQTFFNDLFQLSTQPSDNTLRSIFLQNAVSLTREINAVASQMDSLSGQLATQIEDSVQQINALSLEISELNQQIRLAEARDLDANDLRDRRDQIVNDLAELIDVQIVEQGDGHTVVLVGQGGALIGQNGIELEVGFDTSGDAIVTQAGDSRPINFGGGLLAGMLAAHNEIIPQYESLLASFTSGFISAVDNVHATGIGIAGAHTSLTGIRGVQDVTVPLVSADPTFKIEAGQLFIGVVDQSTGQRTLASVSIDPSTQSLQDVAAAITAVDHLQAVVDSQTGTLSILAEAGYTFDFTGYRETVPDTSGITGTSIPNLSGSYTGSGNEQYDFQVVGSGTVGVSAGLAVEVRNSTGQLIQTLEIGQGYEPGSDLEVVDGITISFSTGDLNAGDNFATSLVANADTAGILAALGLNSFFSGSSPGNVAVNQSILDNPNLLATSINADSGDNSNLQNLIALRDQQLLGGGTHTIEQYLGDIIARVGSDTLDYDLTMASLESLGQHLQAERDSISGVDPNEELVYMLQFQKSFQAAAQFISTLDETLDELFRMVR